MRFIKSVVRGLLALGFKLGLVSLALVTALVMVFGTAGPLKQALKTSGIYNNIVDSVVSDSSTSQGKTTDDVSLADPQIKLAARTAFSPQFIQSSSEQVIDSVYNWLQGKTTSPTFRIDVSGPKLKFAQTVADNAAARARQLPACTLQQTRDLANSDTDPLTIPCLPLGTSPDTIHDQVLSDLSNSQDFIKNPVITADSLPKDSQGQSIVDKASKAPQIFHWLLLAPWILGGLTLLAALLLMLLHDDKRQAIHAIATTLVGSGVFLLVGAWLYTFAFNQLNKPTGRLGKLITNGAQSNLLAIVNALNHAFNLKLYIFGGVYLLLGVAILLFLYFNKRLRQAAETANSEPAPTELPTPTDASTPPPTLETKNAKNQDKK